MAKKNKKNVASAAAANVEEAEADKSVDLSHDEVKGAAN